MQSELDEKERFELLFTKQVEDALAHRLTRYSLQEGSISDNTTV
jgi:hypothetical protein